MECVCPHCGKLLQSGKLCFDLTDEVFARIEVLYQETYQTSAVPETVSRLKTAWESLHLSPAMFSEEELLNLTDGGDKRELCLFTDDWITRLEAYCHDLDRQKQQLRFREAAQTSFQDVYSGIRSILPKHEPEEPGIFYDTRDEFLRIPIRVMRKNDPNNSIVIDSVTTTRNTNTRYCPLCGGELSRWSGGYPELVLTVVGGPRMGKSTALAACIGYFLQNNGTFGISCREDDQDRGWRDFKTHYIESMERNQPVDPTRTTVEVIPRFTVHLEIIDNDGQRQRLNLTVVDLPGEYDRNGEENATISDEIYRHYQDLYDHVDFIWYCTDQTELEQLSDENSDTLKAAGHAAQTKPMPTSRRLAKLQSYGNLMRKNTPALMLLCKSDMIQRNEQDPVLFSDTYQLFEEGTGVRENGKFAPVIEGYNYYDRAYKVREYIRGRNSRLVDGFEAAFPAHTYLATSNYGHNFTDGSSQAKKAYMTEQPLLWMLAVNGYLSIDLGQGRFGQANPDPNDECARAVWENLCMVQSGYRSPEWNRKEKRPPKTSSFFRFFFRFWCI